MASLLVLVVVTAIVFDYINGFHDAANAIATVVSTGVLPLRTAVMIAGGFNFIGAITGTAVATTIATGFADAGDVTQTVVLCALLGACIWNIITWWFGIPSSSSHALIGGLVGAVIVKAGAGALIGAGVWKTVLFIFASPLLGYLLASAMMIGMSWLFRRTSPLRVDNLFRRAQLVSAGLYSLGHGGNDAQKTIGIIWMLLLASGQATPESPPGWVIWSCYLAMGLGTLFGGWRIVRTMGQRLTKLKPVGGFCAETGGAMTLFIASA